MMEILQIPFIQNAIIGGIILAILLSVLSVFINIKNWSFISVGISHATFGGLAIGFYFNLNPTLLGAVFAIVIGFLIGYISRHSKLHEDISIGILFSFSMAFGILLISKSPNYSNDLFTFLFGNILTITNTDIKLIAVFTIFSIAFIYFFFQKIMYCCYDEDVAYTSGINTGFYYYSIIGIIAVATVLSVKLVGVILASAMMILPSAFTSQFFWHYKKVMLFSILFSIFVVLVGIFLSYKFDFPTGAFIVFLYSLVFAMLFLTKKIAHN